MRSGLHPYNIEKRVYHFSFLRDIRIHGIYFNSFTKLLNLYCFLRKEHEYDFYSLILFTEGSGYVQVNNDCYNIEQNTVVIIAPNQLHSFEHLENAEGFVLYFCQDFYVEEFSFMRLLNLYSYTSQTENDACSPCLSLKDMEVSQIISIFNSIRAEYESGTNSDKSALLIRSHLNILLLKLSELYELRYGKSNNSDNVVIHSLSNLVDSCFIKEQQLDFYTRTFNISESQLNEICKKHFNSGLKKVLQNRLMQEARKLLLTSDLTVSEIAYKLNFGDNSYFNKVFKSKTGITPKKFRDIHKRLVPQKS